MAEKRHPNTPPSAQDGEGVRVYAKPGRARRGVRLWMGATLVLIATAAGWWWMLASRTPDAPPADAAPVTVDQEAARRGNNLPNTAPRVGTEASVDAPQPPGRDPDDLATYFQPGDPEPTGAQVIEALHKAGVRSGLGAFNPPGTSPPLEGLAVPDNFDLPPGYVRHHQVTDEGVPIEPILMFAPDITLYDANGRPIAKPANGVVPPELAPPGLPLRWVRVRPQ